MHSLHLVVIATDLQQQQQAWRGRAQQQLDAPTTPSNCLSELAGCVPPAESTLKDGKGPSPPALLRPASSATRSCQGIDDGGEVDTR